MCFLLHCFPNVKLFQSDLKLIVLIIKPLLWHEKQILAVEWLSLHTLLRSTQHIQTTLLSPARIKTHMDVLTGAVRPITKFLPQSLLQENVIVGNAVLAQHESISAQINYRLMQKNRQVWISAGPRWGVKLQSRGIHCHHLWHKIFKR